MLGQHPTMWRVGCWLEVACGMLARCPACYYKHAQVLSPPRIVPLINDVNPNQAHLSADVLLGWDLTNPEVCTFLLNMLDVRKV